MSTYTLYYTPGACSLSPHIALREAKLPFELSKVDLRNKTVADGDWLAINPKGYVPALRLPSGDVLTEGAIMVQYIADQAPEAKLAPAWGGMPRIRLNEWLHFIATELHKAQSPFYNPLLTAELRASLKERMDKRLSFVAEAVTKQPYVTGETFTVADGYAFYALRSWQHACKESIVAWPALVGYYDRLAKRPSVAAALEAEGIKA